jgi:hypothetical protein
MAYAVGPLAALTGIGLTAGATLREWMVACSEWEAETAANANASADADRSHKQQLEEQAAQVKAQMALEEHRARLAQQALALEMEAQERTRKAKAEEALERKRLKVQAETGISGKRKAEATGNFLIGKAEDAEAELGSARKTLDFHLENPDATQERIAEALGITDRSVRNHLKKAKELGLLNNGRH